MNKREQTITEGLHLAAELLAANVSSYLPHESSLNHQSRQSRPYDHMNLKGNKSLIAVNSSIGNAKRSYSSSWLKEPDRNALDDNVSGMPCMCILLHLHASHSLVITNAGISSTPLIIFSACSVVWSLVYNARRNLAQTTTTLLTLVFLVLIALSTGAPTPTSLGIHCNPAHLSV